MTSTSKESEKKLPKKGIVHLQAKKGDFMPIHYEGKIQKITADGPFQFAIDRASHETLIECDRALKKNNIELVDMDKYLKEKKAKVKKSDDEKEEHEKKVNDEAEKNAKNAKKTASK